MKLFYDSITGDIFYAVYDMDLDSFTHTTNIVLTEFEIDDFVIQNKDICIDLKKTEWKFNIQGQRKYYMLGGYLYERENWQEFTI